MNEAKKFKIPLVLRLFAVAFVGISLLVALDNASYISHDAVVTIYSHDWQTGEYKTCNMANVTGESRTNQIILFCGGPLTNDLEDSRQFSVKFWGKTRDDAKKSGDLLFWKCKKNPPDAEAAFDCKKDSQ
jgi:hypothetical protein